MNTDTIKVFREADISVTEAKKALGFKFPEMTIESFDVETRKSSSTNEEKNYYVAILKKAEGFPPEDDAAAEADKDLPEPEEDKPDIPKPTNDEKKDSTQDLLHQIKTLLKTLVGGGEADGPPPDGLAGGPPDLAADRPKDILPPPARPHHDMGRGLGPQNNPAFASTDIAKIAKRRTSVIECPDDGTKIATLAKELNEVLAPFDKQVKQINRGTVKGAKLIRAVIQ